MIQENLTSSVFNIQLFYRSKGARREQNQKAAFIQVPVPLTQKVFAKKINALIKAYPERYLVLQKQEDADMTAILNKEILRIHVKPAKKKAYLHEVCWDEELIEQWNSLPI